MAHTSFVRAIHHRRNTGQKWHNTFHRHQNLSRSGAGTSTMASPTEAPSGRVELPEQPEYTKMACLESELFTIISTMQTSEENGATYDPSCRFAYRTDELPSGDDEDTISSSVNQRCRYKMLDWSSKVRTHSMTPLNRCYRVFGFSLLHIPNDTIR